MAWFGQGKDTIEWEDSKPDVLFYKWPAKEIKRGSKLIIRPGQKAIFYADGEIEGVFEEPGTYDVVSQIVPFLSSLAGFFSLRGDTGMRAEVYFVNAKELLLPWGTRQRVMIPTPEVPSGIPVGCNGNLIVVFRDYLKFINQIAGVRQSFALSDISERIMGELSGIISEAILGDDRQLSLNALIGLQANQRKIGKQLCGELDSELTEWGLGVADVNILSFNYPPEVQKMAEKVAAQSFVGDVGKYAAINMADGMGESGGNNMATMGAQMAMGVQMGQQMASAMAGASAPKAAPAGKVACASCGHLCDVGAKFCGNCGKEVASAAAGDRFCPQCRKMVGANFCPNCGTKTV